MAFCINCQTKLPEGARFCFICGEAVSQAGQGTGMRIGRGELVPVIKDQPTSDREFVRIRDVVSVSDDAAALVVYCHSSQQGQKIRVGLDPDSPLFSTPRIYLRLRRRP